MNSAALKGNDPVRWEKLLTALDEKLQLGLLDYLSRIVTYHFESDTLYIEPGSKSDSDYLTKSAVLHQLELLAQDATRIEKVKIKTPSAA